MRLPEHTAAYKLTHYNYFYTVPAFYYYTTGSRVHFSVPVPPGKGGLSQSNNQPMMVRDTILQMALDYDEDIDLQLRYPEESTVIYDIIVEHLNTWKEMAQRDPSISDIPLDDLRKLDTFAEALHGMANRYRPKNTAVPTSYQDKVTAMIKQNKVGRNAVKETKPSKPVGYKSIFDIINERVSERNDRWK